MRSTPLLAEAEPLEAYIVRVRFEDGTMGEVDLRIASEDARPGESTPSLAMEPSEPIT